MHRWSLVFVVLCACGLGHSSSLEEGDAGDGGGGGIQDAGRVAACPSAPPAEGAKCTQSQLVCEYGTDVNAACNTVARCGSGVWAVTPPGTKDCPTPAASSQKGCPASYTSGADTVCTDQGLSCGYPQGRCVCSQSFSGPPMADASARVQWHCDQPTEGCPVPRPLAGTACSKPDQYCDYGGCSMPNGSTMQCKQGSWTESMIACPLAN